MHIIENNEERRFFADGDKLAREDWQWEPFSPERAARRRRVLALVLTGLILLLGALLSGFMLPPPTG